MTTFEYEKPENNMPLNELLTYIVFVIGFAISPGPNQMLYLTYTFEYGRKAGWATAAGIVSAFVVHLSAIILGLTALLISRPFMLDLLRYLGIAYLFFLAINNLKTRPWKKNETTMNAQGLIHFYYKGLICNLLNPGSVVLYFSLLPQFIHADRGHFLAQNLLLGGVQMGFSFLTNCTIIFFAGYATHTFFKDEKNQNRLKYAMSFLIVVFAIRMFYITVN